VKLERDGISVDLPAGWEGRIYRQSDQPVAVGLRAAAGETFPTILQVGNFALPPDTGDYGSGAVELMDRNSVLIVLRAEDEAAASQPLFRAEGLPRPLAPNDFDPNSLQRTLQGQSGVQRFFHANGRGYCLYVVLGSHALRGILVREVNRVLAAVTLT
jgi:hypothetical protein